MIEKINNYRYHILGFILVYFVLRFITFFFQPEHLVNTIISIAILMVTAYLLYKRNDYGWYIVASEFILGGVGNFLSIDFLSLRTALLIITIVIFAINKIRDNHLSSIYYNNKTICYIFLAMYAIVGISALQGYYLGNDLKLIIADGIPYLFLLYYFPLKELYLDKKFRSFVLNILVATILANLIFVLFTFVMYSIDIFTIHDTYYKFFRDIAGGKITDLGNNFFRVVLDEHLLLVPLLIYFVYQSIQKNEILYKVSAIALLIILSINLSRIYILAFIFSLLLIFTLKYWKRYLIYSLSAILILIVSFSAIHFISSHGKTVGWELFGLRIQSITQPEIEQSSLSRMLLLPRIIEQIKDKPLLGHGLGSTILVQNPILNKEVTTSQFDWGYLEIIAEMGVVGIVIWLTLLLYISKYINLFKSFNNTKLKMYLALLASLLVITLTAPAVFHVFGIVLIVILLTKINTFSSDSAGGIVMNNKNQIALVEQKKHDHFPSSWCYPKGHQEQDESFQQTAKREVYEETGIKDMEYIKELGEYSRYTGDNLQSGELKNIRMFLFKTKQEHLKPVDQENPDAKWFKLSDVKQRLSYTADKNFFEKIINKLNI